MSRSKRKSRRFGDRGWWEEKLDYLRRQANGLLGGKGRSPRRDAETAGVEPAVDIREWARQHNARIRQEWLDKNPWLKR